MADVGVDDDVELLDAVPTVALDDPLDAAEEGEASLSGSGSPGASI